MNINALNQENTPAPLKQFTNLKSVQAECTFSSPFLMLTAAPLIRTEIKRMRAANCLSGRSFNWETDPTIELRLFRSAKQRS